MAERIVSPGVFTRENDLSFLAQGIGEIGAAFIGPFKQGPAFVPTIVRTQSEFETIFGTPDGTYYTEYAVQNYLREAGTATIVRVAGTDGYSQVKPLGIFATASNSTVKLIGTLHSTDTGYQDYGFEGTIISVNTTTSGSFLLSGSGLPFISASIKPTATNDLSDVFGESPFGAKKAYTYTYFEKTAANLLVTMSADGIAAVELPTQDFSYEASVAATPYVKSQLVSGDRYDLFKFHTLGHGNVYNTKFKIGISNVKAAGEDGSTDYSTFTVTVRSFDDTDKRKVVLETFNNVNLDPASPNYIARRIGDRYITIDNDGKITENGDYTNQSKYIRVEIAEAGSFPISAAPFGHGAYTNPIECNTTVEAGKVPAVVFAFDSQLNYQLTGSASTDMVKRQFVLAFQGGYDGMNPAVKINLGSNITAANTQGFNCSTGTSSGTTAYFRAINAVSNPDEYDINLVATPGIIRSLHPSVTTKVIDMVEARSDAFYIADFTEAGATITQATEAANAVDSNYVACYYPWVKTIDTNSNKLTSVPPSVLLPAVFASNDRLAAEWFAPAGLNRGGITGAVSVLNRLTHSERDTLYENKVNPIAAFPGQGIVAFGQKTLQDKASALDRINVRRLLITVKKFIASTSRFLVFEQNTSTTRNRFLNTVNPYLEGIQQRQGLYAFRVVMDESNNTPDVIDRNILAGQIFLQPAKTAEFIVIDFNILPTGASFNA